MPIRREHIHREWIAASISRDYRRGYEAASCLACCPRWLTSAHHPPQGHSQHSRGSRRAVVRDGSEHALAKVGRPRTVTLATRGLARPSAQNGHALAQARVQSAAVALAQARAQAATAWARAAQLLDATKEAVAAAQAARRISAEVRREWLSSTAGRDRLQRSEYARLLARLETMPVIEQAKGIIMAQSGCGVAEAFDLLRRASQRSNVPVRDLAAQIVAGVVARAGQAESRHQASGQHPARTG